MSTLNKLGVAAIVAIVVAGISVAVPEAVHVAHHGAEGQHSRSIQAGGDDEWYD